MHFTNTRTVISKSTKCFNMAVYKSLLHFTEVRSRTGVLKRKQGYGLPTPGPSQHRRLNRRTWHNWSIRNNYWVKAAATKHLMSRSLQDFHKERLNSQCEWLTITEWRQMVYVLSGGQLLIIRSVGNALRYQLYQLLTKTLMCLVLLKVEFKVIYAF